LQGEVVEDLPVMGKSWPVCGKSWTNNGGICDVWIRNLLESGKLVFVRDIILLIIAKMTPVCS
jgi:hypothetical protein